VLDSQQITDDLRGQFRGDLHFDALTRGLYATDASPFQITPLAVAVPEDAADVSALVQYCFNHNIPVIPRGAGTGLAGESLGPAIVLDLSVNFKQILNVDTESITVQVGVTCADLNAELARYGRRFAPDPASAATCTVGGMVATNASGGNAFRFGYTRDHVIGLDVVWDTGAADNIGTSRIDNQKIERTQAIEKATAALLNTNADAIARHASRAMFDRCGYQLHGASTPEGADLAKILVGSEGTLGIVTAAKLRTIPLPGGTSLTLLGFPTLDAAVRASLDVRKFEPVVCDLLDRRLLSITRRTSTGEGVGQIPTSVGAALMIAHEADTEREATERAWGMVETLRQSHLMLNLAEPTHSPEGIARVRGIRQAVVAGLYALSRGPRPVSFIEDVGVPVEALPEYLAGVQSILKRAELSASFLIHTLLGQVHTRPLIDLENPTDRAKLWPVAESVHALALSLGGTVSTQHGTGIARTPWVERQVGPLYPVFRELKRIFDPKNVLNPGKIVGPDPSREAWPLRAIGRAFSNPEASRDSGTSPDSHNETATVAPEPTNHVPRPTSLLVWKDSQPAEEAARCSGCGDCRTKTVGKRMCPIFRATGAEAASPRAKANLLRMMAIPNEVASEDVKAVAALCINCKMCRDECDARVNIPKLMLEAKAAHQAEHGLNRSDWILARAESFAAFGSNFAPIVNGLLARKSFRWILEKLTGISRRRRLPAFALHNFFRWARGQGLTKNRRSEAPLGKLHSSRSRMRVAFFVDVFAGYNDPLIARAAVAVLQHQGVEVYVPPRQAGCGIAALAVGDIDTAREAAQYNVRIFSDLIREGYRIVCTEPSAALMLSQDYCDLLDDADTASLAANTVELTAYLEELQAGGRLRTDFQPLNLTLGHHVPCHMKALRRQPASPQLLSLIPGMRVHTIDVGCSGMAGSWGLKAVNYATSLNAGAPVFAELNRPGVLFGSSECSTCRMQMQEGSGKRTLHPVEYLAYSYGLLPEIGNKLEQPLGDLVSD
jgi:FAD/FMN-containing dehydrogenase/Fe-S oxidoreductase